MKTDFSEILISEKEAEKIALSTFGIRGVAAFLPGEIDFNFKILDENDNAYVLKISRPGISSEFLDFQQQLLTHLESAEAPLEHPRALPDITGKLLSKVKDSSGTVRFARLLSWIPGRIYSKVNPKSDQLRMSLGRVCGAATAALSGFDHPQSKRVLVWDIAQAGWTANHLDLFPEKKQKTIRHFLNLFNSQSGTYNTLRKSVVHNDANDNNLIVSNDLLHPVVRAAIDYGDAVHTQIINDLAVACAYAIMGLNDPLDGALPVVQGYHQSFPLREEELEHLYARIGIRLVISVTKSA